MSISSHITCCLLPLFLCFGYSAFCQDKAPADTVAVADSVGTAAADEDSVETTAAVPAADTFALRTLPDTLAQRWKRDPALAYANDPAYWQKEPVKPEDHRLLLGVLDFLTSKWFRYTLYTLLITLLGYAIIRIMNENNVRLFYRSPNKRKSLSGQELPSGEMEEDLGQRLQHFIQMQDYRQATRYLYLISLTLLNEKGLIQWHRDTTNQEYLLQLKGSAWEASFRYLTGIYDKVWYGEFPLGETQFNRLHHYFEDFYKTVPA